MALKHTRGFLWRGEDLGSGTGNVKERILSAIVPAAGAPLAISPSFNGSTTYPSGLLGTVYTPSLNGLNRFITNQSSTFFMTLTGRLDSAAGILLTFPIPPLQTVFLPANFTGVNAVLNADSSFPLVLPIGTLAGPQAVAGNANPIMYDLVIEQ